MIIKNFPYYGQCMTSAACGTHSLRMILDYYGIVDESGAPYSTGSLTKYLKVSKKEGCDEEEILKFIDSVGLKYDHCRPKEYAKALKLSRPVLCAFEDEGFDGHYAPLIGMEGNELIFNDPWPEYGEKCRREFKQFIKQGEIFDNWGVCVYLGS